MTGSPDDEMVISAEAPGPRQRLFDARLDPPVGGFVVAASFEMFRQAGHHGHAVGFVVGIFVVPGRSPDPS